MYFVVIYYTKKRKSEAFLKNADGLAVHCPLEEYL